MPAAGPIVCVGAALWDTIARAGAPLAPGADVPGRVERRPGGVAANVARRLAAHGRRVALLAAVGRDESGDRLIAALAEAGVDCSHVLRLARATDRYVAVEDARGELFAAVADCACLEAAGADLLRPLSAGALAPVRVVADGNLAGPVLRAILAGPVPVALACASPAKAALLPTLAGARNAALYLNRREAEALCARSFDGSRAAAAALVARGLAEAVVTDAAAPATHARAGALVTVPPPAIAAGGTTGAGDAFLAAHLAALADGLAPEPALRAALAASARHVAGAVA